MRRTSLAISIRVLNNADGGVFSVTYTPFDFPGERVFAKMKVAGGDGYWGPPKER